MLKKQDILHASTRYKDRIQNTYKHYNHIQDTETNNNNNNNNIIENFKINYN